MGWLRKRKTPRDTRVNTNDLWQQEREIWLSRHSGEKKKQGLWASLLEPEKRERVKVVISLFTLVAAVGLIGNLLATQKTIELTEKRLITDRFAKSSELLANKNISARIAAIYSLERIAKDSQDDHWTIMELLSAYISEKSPLPAKGKQAQRITTDVQTALTVIGRRQVENDREIKLLLRDRVINLTYTNLSGANLKEANLNGANLTGVTLNNANLNSANLNSALFLGANLTGANLTGAKLRGAKLTGANLTGAWLTGADLEYAFINRARFTAVTLNNANLNNTRLDGTDLSGTDLTSVNLSETGGITPTQVKSAKDWPKATYSDSFRKKLGIP